MPPLFNPRLVNSPFGDPGLFVPFFFNKRALLFDIGDISSLAPKDILKITHCFVSHTHMDHFIGFDHLLRITLGRGKELHLFGPQGFHDNVAGKLAGYTWNLVDNYTESVTLVVTELRGDQMVKKRYDCRDRFLPSGEAATVFEPPIIYSENTFSVEAVPLEHNIPCLAFAIKERFHVNIRKEMLGAMDLEPGKWLYDFKQMIHEGLPPDTRVPIVRLTSGACCTLPLGELSERLAIITRGAKIAYVTDAAGTRENTDRIIALARDCDHLFIEASFLDEHAHLAARTRHLTAYQAGCIAGAAGAKRFTLFHYSPRHEGEEDAMMAEAMSGFRKFSDGFKGPIPTLPGNPGA